ncbi:MAG TPA: PilZ domain-containing protein [Polyangia bacterium]|nr:PilZ domain-containing protein [Polyangia bacterium]
MEGRNDPAERRAAPRFQVAAQAKLVSGGEAHLLAVRNISATGVFLDGRPRDHGDLVPGAEIEIVIAAAGPGKAGDELVHIACRGRVARIEFRTAFSPGGFGIVIDPKTDQDQERLEDLLGRLIALPADQRPVSIG